MKNTNNTSRHPKRRKAQGMTEYVIIVGLIAMGIFGAVAKFGGVLERSFQGYTETVEDITKEMDEKNKPAKNSNKNKGPK